MKKATLVSIIMSFVELLADDTGVMTNLSSEDYENVLDRSPTMVSSIISSSSRVSTTPMKKNKKIPKFKIPTKLLTVENGNKKKKPKNSKKLKKNKIIALKKQLNELAAAGTDSSSEESCSEENTDDDCDTDKNNTKNQKNIKEKSKKI